MEHPQHAKIEAYLDGALPPDERQAFEAQLASDPGLAQALRLYEAARGALTLQGLLDHRAALHRRGQQLLFWKKWLWQIQDVLSSWFSVARTDGSSRPRWGLIGGLTLATALLLLVALRPELFFPEPPATPGPKPIPKNQAIALFQQQFSRYDVNNTLGGTDTDSVFQKAQDQYQAGNCAAATATLDTLLADPAFERRPLALLLRGSCQLEQGAPQAAIETLAQVPASAARLHEEAQWYIALAYLAQGDGDKASDLLLPIAHNARNRHAAQAQEMLGLEK